MLEGGSIDVNGQGLLLTTEECLLSDVQARNPGLSRRGLRGGLRRLSRRAKVLWLGRGIAGDDTHGHVDDLARFVGPRTVVTVVEDDRGRRQLRAAAGEPATAARHDRPGRPAAGSACRCRCRRRCTFDGQRLPASYANFYIANDRVLVPTFNDPHDRRALDMLAELFPDRTVVGIHAVDLVWGLGTLHCLTQQQPAV